MEEINEIGRCHCCGATLSDESEFFCPASERFAGPHRDGLGFCEAAYLRRVENGWPIPSFIPWDEEVLRREAVASNSYAPRDRRGGGDHTCPVAECAVKVNPPKVYCSESHRALQYRRRQKGLETV